jgi:hypothetical protein
MFWEELISCFPFTTTLVCDTTGRKSVLCMRNEGKNITIREASVLVLLMGGIYETHYWHSLRWHDIHTKFHDDRFRPSKSILRYTHADNKVISQAYFHF